MHCRHEPFRSLCEAWDAPPTPRSRRRLAAALPALAPVAGPIDACADPTVLAALVAVGGKEGRRLAMSVVAGRLDRVASQLARCWRTDGDDVAAALAERAWSRLATAPGVTDPAAWVVGGARDAVREQLRTAARRQGRTVALDHEPPGGKDPAEVVVTTEVWARAAARVAPGEVAVMVATRADGWPLVRWADAAGLRPAQAYGLRRRAESRLRAAS